jgi:hypothetical protein
MTDSRIAEIREHFQGDDRNAVDELIAHIR